MRTPRVDATTGCRLDVLHGRSLIFLRVAAGTRPAIGPGGAVGDRSLRRTTEPRRTEREHPMPDTTRRRTRFRDLGIRTRLGLAFGAIGLLVVGCAAGGVGAVGEQRDLAQQIGAVDGVLQDAETMRFQIADATGWQGFVLGDAAAFGPEVALADDSYNRAGFLASKASIYDWLDALDTSGMNAAEKAQVDQLRPAWDSYFDWDAQVVAWVRPGTQDGLATAMTSINGGDAG